jgi:hypothetical protein
MVALNVNTATKVLGGSISFGSLEFAVNSTGGLRYVPDFDPNQAFCFESLEFMAY